MELTRLSKLGPHLNAYTFSFPDEALDEARALFRSDIAPTLDRPENRQMLRSGAPVTGILEEGDRRYSVTSYGDAPLLWVSCDNVATYDVFARAFESLAIADDVKQLVDYESGIRMYCGFFVVGSHMPSENWHVDYGPGANAYTLLTPLFELADGQGELLYRDWQGTPNQYTYRLGEGLIVGEHLDHATQPYAETESLRTLLSLTFGTDKIEYWSNLSPTIGHQSRYLVLPCGHEQTACTCLG